MRKIYMVLAGAGAFVATLAAAQESEPSPHTPRFVPAPVVQSLPAIAVPPQDVPAPAGTADSRSHASLAALVADLGNVSTADAQLRCLAGAIYFEARGEPLGGQLAVAKVIMNRAASGRFPASYCGVVHQPRQFSFVRGNAMPRIDEGSRAWARAKAIAHIAHEHLWDSEAGGALYFHATHVSPSWSRKKTQLARIETHVFYR